MEWVWRTIGYGLGSALVAGIGRVVGHLTDRWTDDHDLTVDESTTLLVACFLARFATETGHIESEDRQLIARICTEFGETSTLSKDKILCSLDEWGANDELFGVVIDAARGDEDVRYTLLTCGWRFASRDNRLDDDEVSWLVTVAEGMGASDEDLQLTMLRYYRPPNDETALVEALNTFGVPAGATQQEIEKRYRELSRKYHPDSHATAHETLKELAAEKFAKIAAAYEFLHSAYNNKYCGITADGNAVFVPKSKDLVRCFFCHQKCQLAEKDHFATSRCPRCQALLLFEEEFAQAIFSALEDSKETMHGAEPEDDICKAHCPRGHGELRDWNGMPRCWTCGWPEK